MTGNPTADSLLQKIGALPPDEKAAIGMSHLPAIGEANLGGGGAFAGLATGAGTPPSPVIAAPAARRALPLPNMPAAPPAIPNMPAEVPTLTGQQLAPESPPAATSFRMAPASQVKGIGPLAGSPQAINRAELNRLTVGPESRPGYEQIRNPFLRGLATAGNVASMFFPAEAAMIPGTALHHQRLVNLARGTEQQYQGQQAAEDTQRLREAQATAEEAKPELAQSKLDQARAIQAQALAEKRAEALAKENELAKWHQNENETALLKAGFRRNPLSGTPEAVPLGELPAGQQAATRLRWAQEEEQVERANLARVQAEGDPQKIKIQQQNADTAAKRVENLSKQLLSGKPVEYLEPGTGVLRQAHIGEAIPPGAMTMGGQNAVSVAGVKSQVQEAKTAKEARDQYSFSQQLAGQRTGPADIGLIMQFMGAVKPEQLGKMRFNKGEQDFILGTRSLIGSVEAWQAKIDKGELLPEEQRQQMVQVMKLIADRYPEGAPAAAPSPGQTVHFSIPGQKDKWIPADKVDEFQKAFPNAQRQAK